MNECPLVSIIIPVFNVIRYLHEALDSVISQSYTNLDIIIVDDGSTDGSGKICDEYACRDNRIRVIHQENKGLSTARNVGLEKTQGEVVAFLDADDAYHTDYIMSMLIEMVHNETDVVVCRYAVFKAQIGTLYDTVEKSPTMEPGIYDHEIILQCLVEGTMNNHVWNKLYRKQLFEIIRFPDGHVYEDIDTTFRIIELCTRICVLDEVLYFQRKRFGSITEVNSIDTLYDMFLSYYHLEQFVERNTPNVFTPNHLDLSRRALFNSMISYYKKISCSKGNISKRESIAFRRRILEIGSSVGTGDCKLRRKICYLMIRYCPVFFRIINPIYQYVMQIGKRIYMLEIGNSA